MKNYTPKKFEHLTKIMYKFINEPFPPIINNFFLYRETTYQPRNFQSLFSDNKKTVKFGTETITPRGLQIWTHIP